VEIWERSWGQIAPAYTQAFAMSAGKLGTVTYLIDELAVDVVGEKNA